MNSKILVFLFCILFYYGCGKVDNGPYYNYANNIHSFDGNIGEFLESQSGVYDSLLLVLKRFPALDDSIVNDSITLVAASNESFKLALDNLNSVRRGQNKISLNLNTIDSTNLDTLLSRYIIRGIIPTDSVIIYIDGLDVYGIKYSYPMHFKVETSNASGSIDAGPKSLLFSDTKKSWLTSAWISSYTSSVDIHCNNGIVHTLVTSHVFGFEEFTNRFNK